MVTVLGDDSEKEYAFCQRVGARPGESILLTRLDTGVGHWDVYDWPSGSRTMQWAHQILDDKGASWVKDQPEGFVLDVEYEKGMKSDCKTPEIN